MTEQEEKIYFNELMESDEEQAETQYQIGVCYLYGKGVEKNVGEAEKWLQRAAAQNHENARKLLNGFQEEVTGAVEITEETLAEWCEKAEDGDVNAQFEVAKYLHSYHREEAKTDIDRYLQAAIDKGSAEACLIRAKDKIEEGKFEEAISLLKNAADNGLPEAQRLLGQCYADGIGSEKNLEKAEAWFVRAAEQGNGAGKLEMALRYRTGDGVAKSFTRALAWVKKASDAGLENARELFEHGAESNAWK